MFSKLSFSILFLVHSAYSCIPTQQTCSNCAPFYDATCDPYSYGPAPMCEAIDDVAPSYSYSAGTCSITLTCAGGNPRYFPGNLIPGPGVAATCSESTGVWYLSGSVVNNMQCV